MGVRNVKVSHKIITFLHFGSLVVKIVAMSNIAIGVVRLADNKLVDWEFAGPISFFFVSEDE